MDEEILLSRTTARLAKTRIPGQAGGFLSRVRPCWRRLGRSVSEPSSFSFWWQAKFCDYDNRGQYSLENHSAASESSPAYRFDSIRADSISAELEQECYYGFFIAGGW